ncbi:MAG: GFA family protein [Pseudomonadota bacterium]|nr:GFA family protein [Pseudomonadota bacterium]
MSQTIEGGCLCGNIRFRTTSEPSYQLLCYCTDCQAISGAACFAAYGVPIESIILTKGEPKVFDIAADSGRVNSRRFCPDCGSRIWAQIDELGLASVNAFALDHKDHFKPSSNHCPESAPVWSQVDGSLEYFPRIPRE